MNSLTHLLPQHWMEAIGLTILHSLWQGLLVAALAAVALYALRRFPARIRYRVAFAALTLIPLLALITFAKVYRAPVTVASLTPAQTAQVQALVAATHQTNFHVQIVDEQPAYLQLLPYVVGLWMIGVLIFLARFAGGFTWMQRLRWSEKRKLPWQFGAKLDRWRMEKNLRRRVSIAESTLVDAPLLIGYFRPLIVLPLGTITAMPKEQIEALMAHELGHVLRHDFIANLFQELLAVIFFYHPATWWLNKQIRNEREDCADDIAIELGVDQIDLAKALAGIEERRHAAAQLALAANGGSLLHRIRRMLAGRTAPSPRERAGAVVLLLAGLVIVMASATMAQARERREKAEKLKKQQLTHKNELAYADAYYIDGDTSKTKKKTPPVPVNPLIPPIPPVPPTGFAPVAPGLYWSLPDTGTGDIVIHRDKNGMVSSITINGKDQPLNTDEWKTYVEQWRAYSDQATLQKDLEQQQKDQEQQQKDEWQAYADQWKAYGEQWQSYGDQLRSLYDQNSQVYVAPVNGRLPRVFMAPSSAPPAVYYGDLFERERALELRQKDLRRLNKKLKQLDRTPGVYYLPTPEAAPYIVMPPAQSWSNIPPTMPSWSAPTFPPIPEIDLSSLDSLDERLEELRKAPELTNDYLRKIEKVQAAIEDELISDKLITSKDHFDFSISKDSMEVSGKKQSAELHEKYYAIIKKFMGELEGDSRFQINK